MIILKKISLEKKNFSRKKTIHTLGNEILPMPAALKVGKYEDDTGYYLLYIDADGNEMTDTYHDTLNQALEQAEYEFNVSPEDWCHS